MLAYIFLALRWIDLDRGHTLHGRMEAAISGMGRKRSSEFAAEIPRCMD